jgi:hypothetical protein
MRELASTHVLVIVPEIREQLMHSSMITPYVSVTSNSTCLLYNPVQWNQACAMSGHQILHTSTDVIKLDVHYAYEANTWRTSSDKMATSHLPL